MMPPGTREYRPARRILLLTAATAAVVLVLAAVALVSSLPLWQRGAAMLLAMLAVLGVAEVASRRLELSDRGIDYVANLRRHSIPRDEIQTVAWARSSGVSVRLNDGRWIHLPEVGRNSESLSNSIKAWLDRTTSGS